MAQTIEPEVRRYLASVQRVAPLARAEELALCRAFLEHGDRRAADRVITANLRHVVPHALRYRHMGVPFADLIAQGNLGLLLALRGFDPGRGLRFATYANHWVRSEMLAFALRTRRLVGGGRGALRSVYALRMRREHTTLCNRLGDDPGVHRILSEQYRKSPDEIASILHQNEQRDASLDAPAARGGRHTLLATLSLDEPGQDEALLSRRTRAALTTAVASAISALDARERFIVEARMMADDDTRLSLAEIGQRFGVSRERARQLESKAKAKLRSRLATLADQPSFSTAA